RKTAVPPQFCCKCSLNGIQAYPLRCNGRNPSLPTLQYVFGKPLGKVFGESFPAASHRPAALLQEHPTLTWFLQRILVF
ncbi:MAG: hypothetical protein IJN00_03990, partial [Clostridia bacterium]|nr:hypothetical protein [Clostridia bacterium]